MSARVGASVVGFVRVAIVVTMFIVVPVGVWWIATPMITDLPLSPDIRRLLMLSVLGTLVFGGASGALVLKSMAEEP